MTGMPPNQPLERQIAAGIVVAALLAALAGIGIRNRLTANDDPSADGNTTVDAIASALSRGVAPQPMLEAFVAAGTIRSATVFAQGGQPLAAAGKPSPSAEQIFRTLPGGGSLAVEPRPPIEDSNLPVNAVLAAACALVASLLVGSWTLRSVRRRLDGVRAAVDDAARDQTYATRVHAERGALRPLTSSVNQLLEQVQQRDLAARRRTIALETANKDLESFAATVSHDLRAPVGSIAGFAQALDEDYGPKLDDLGRECIHWIRQSATQMSNIIEGMLKMARLSRVEVHRTEVDITRMAREITDALHRGAPDRDVEFVIREGIVASADERLLRAVLENLIGNAFKFTSKRPGARIEIGARDDEGTLAFYVRDNGAGFAPEHAAKMFRPFQRLHSEKEFSGTGIGLATVHRIVQRHGGRVWAEGEPEKGATIYFTTGTPEERAA